MLSSISRRFASTATSGEIRDVVIVGGGVAGAALACALRRNEATSDLQVMVVDANDSIKRPLKDAKPDARCVALTPRSRSVLDACGPRVWARITENGRVRAFENMQAWDGVGGGHVSYAASELGAEALGHVVENSLILEALEREMETLGVERVGKASASETRAPRESEAGALAEAKISVDEDGKTREFDVRARLIVAADGPKSAVRKSAGIKIAGWGYGQRAVVGTVRTDRAHSTAWQRFLPTGPIALLPIGDGTYSNVVWTTTPSEAKRLAEDVSDEEFAQEVHDALQGLGAYKSPFQENFDRFATLRFFEDAVNQAYKPLVRVTRETMSRAVGVPVIESAEEDTCAEFAPRFRYPPFVSPAGTDTKRGSFPLSTHHALSLTKPRLALIGDAAHVVHPLGGQGLNLGLRDAELLVNAIARARELGQDIGSASALAPYARASVAANVPMMAALDGLQKLFSAETYPVTFARSLGLAAVNATAPVRRKIAWYAMGGA
jgi:ubiquinone biosynthesis monooxygenase Coq6